MDCHINCHGELNMIMMSIPVVALTIAKIRARINAWRRGR